MITCNLMGGLGNQLFQMFAVISYAIQTRNIFKFYNIDKLCNGRTTTRNTYWNSFLFNLTPFLVNEFPVMDIIKEKDFTYNPISLKDLIQKDVCLVGYFQSYKYFEKYYKTICKIIKLNEIKDNILIKSEYTREFLEKSISLHFRIGDYKKFINFEIMEYIYYEKAIEYIKQKSNINYNILFFCEDQDIDEVTIIINKLNDKFKEDTFIKVNNNLDDWEEMIVMSLCLHNIIANSSFSWWGAYFNENKEKIVCYPSKWFKPFFKCDTKDLCPNEWIKINM